MKISIPCHSGRRLTYVWVMRHRGHENNRHRAAWFIRPGPVVVSAVLLEALRRTVGWYDRADGQYEHAVARMAGPLIHEMQRWSRN